MSKLKFIEKAVLILISVFPAFFIGILFVAQYPAWWKWIIFERTPMTWIESVILYTCAIVALGCASLTFLKNEPKPAKLWVIMGMAFFYLSLDERFAIHERIRDNMLAPNEIQLPVFFWTAYGDFILLILLVIGFIMLPWLLSLFKERRVAFYCFISAIFFSAIAVIMDSIEVKMMAIEIQRIEQFVEEILETVGMLLFLSAFFLMLMYHLTHLLNNSTTAGGTKDNA